MGPHCFIFISVQLSLNAGIWAQSFLSFCGASQIRHALSYAMRLWHSVIVTQEQPIPEPRGRRPTSAARSYGGQR